MQTGQNWKRMVVGSVAGLALVAGTVWAAPSFGVAYAQDETPATVAESDVALMQWGHGGGGLRSGAGLGDDILANALGITTAELQTARQEAFASVVAQAVEDGEITQEQADAMVERGIGGRGIGLKELSGSHTEALAEALGITVDELDAAIDNAPDAAVEAGLLTQAQADEMKFHQLVQESVTNARETAIQQAVSEGLISQAQADQMLEAGGYQFGPHMGGMRGGPEGGRRGGFERGGAQGLNLQRPDRDGEHYRFGPNQVAPQPEEEAPVSPSSTSL